MSDQEENETQPRESNWFNVLFYTYVQILMFYGILIVFTQAYYITTFFTLLLIYLAVIGVTAGAHRLWAHRSYNAITELKIFFMLCQTLAGQGTIYDWVVYHRIHHNHFETNLDPFNPKRGFFYSHMFCLTKQPLRDIDKLIKEVDVSDLEADSVVMFQKKYYWIIFFFTAIVIPIYIPLAYFGESFLSTILVAQCMRYGVTLHFAWLVHSATIVLGLQKGEKFPSDTNVVFLFYKTHWLKYHHLAPWDYQTGEYGKYGNDYVTIFIKICTALELVTNLRTVTSDVAKNALYLSMKSKKPLSECLIEVEANQKLPKDHYLEPKKFIN